jgi:hypothetical protein
VSKKTQNTRPSGQEKEEENEKKGEEEDGEERRSTSSSRPLNYSFSSALTLLEAWQGKTLREVDLTAQVRHELGAEVPEIAPLTASAAAISPRLQRWLTSP